MFYTNLSCTSRNIFWMGENIDILVMPQKKSWDQKKSVWFIQLSAQILMAIDPIVLGYFSFD